MAGNESGGQNTKYYCVFRSTWNAENQPTEYPELARWGNPLMFSHTKQYAPYIKGRAAPYGVEQIAEVRANGTRQGFADSRGAISTHNLLLLPFYT